MLVQVRVVINREFVMKADFIWDIDVQNGDDPEQVYIYGPNDDDSCIEIDILKIRSGTGGCPVTLLLMSDI